MKNTIAAIFSVFITVVCDAQNKTGSDIMDSLFRIKASESIGKPFPEFSARFDNRIITKDSLSGKVVFINFWFEACPPCIAELPALNNLFKKYKDNKNFRFISFTYESPARIIALKKKYHIEYKVASVSNNECYRLNQNNGFPTSIVLDRSGIIHDLFTGGDTDRLKAAVLIKTKVYRSIETALNH